MKTCPRCNFKIQEDQQTKCPNCDVVFAQWAAAHHDTLDAAQTPNLKPAKGIWGVGVYTVAGAVIRLLTPLAFSGFLVMPVCMIFYKEERIWLGLLFVLVAVGAFLCNVYLSARRTHLDSGMSYFPAVVMLAGSPALLLLGYGLLPDWKLYLGFALIAALDLIGQPIIGAIIGMHSKNGTQP